MLVGGFLEAIWRWSLKPTFLQHRLVPARARNVTTQLRKARLSSVWAPSCQDVTPGGHAGVGVISLHGAPLLFPHFSIPLSRSSFEKVVL